MTSSVHEASNNNETNTHHEKYVRINHTIIVMFISMYEFLYEDGIQKIVVYTSVDILQTGFLCESRY